MGTFKKIKARLGSELKSNWQLCSDAINTCSERVTGVNQASGALTGCSRVWVGDRGGGAHEALGSGPSSVPSGPIKGASPLPSIR